MTIEEFKKGSFGAKDKAIYKGSEYEVASVDFQECLIGLYLNIQGSEPDEISWVRCENVTYISYLNENKVTC